MIPLGILASQFDAPVGGGSYDLLQTEILAGSAASVTFSDLGDYASTYHHLQIRFVARSDRSGQTNTRVRLQFNGLTAASYFSHELEGNGSTVASSATTSSSSILIGRINGPTSTANAFGATVIDVLDPFSTSKNTTFRSLSGSTSYDRIGLFSGSLANTASLTEIKVLDEFANFIAGSRFSIYGLRSS